MTVTAFYKVKSGEVIFSGQSEFCLDDVVNDILINIGVN